ncbi:MAG: hypothetical protein M1825_002721 [Sarcosagium campestre]|nr:MAG: hypothetical protein M1825_002721 [Sarcosagium campestre]
MVQPDDSGKIYSATYSNVPVYEFNVEGNHVMRRRSDDWINATHILKVAAFDKPARTRILEREVQKGVHEKVQGGYGKYQGTWVPLPDGRELAKRNGVLEKMRPIFDYVPGDRSPPLAPKHTTAASNKPRVSKAAAKRAPRKSGPSRLAEDHYDNIGSQLHDEDTPDNTTIDSYEDDEMMHMSQQSTASRKRKRNAIEQTFALSQMDEQHIVYADELLDYFMVSSSEHLAALHKPPEPPMHFAADRPIDEQGHAALHWAAAMGDIAVVKDLIGRGASTAVLSANGETPLMRAVLFTNNFEKQSLPKLIYLLLDTVDLTDYYGSTVFHHIAATTNSRSKYLCARYYCDTIVNKLSENFAAHEITRILDMQDRGGDTALTIAARNGARKLIRSLMGHGASSHLPNRAGETAEQIIIQLNNRRREMHPIASSSPFQPDPDNAKREVSTSGVPTAAAPVSSHRSEAASMLATSFAPVILEKGKKLAEAFDSELVEKESGLEEAKRLRSNMNQELSAVRQQTFTLLTTDDDGPTEQAERDELARLERDSVSLIEQLQRHELHALVRKEESALSPAQQRTTSNQPLNDDQLHEKLQLAAQLLRAQLDRHALVTEVVQNQAVASGLGANDRQPMYRKLIGKCLDIPEGNVEALLPGIAQELEMAKMSDHAMLGAIPSETPS